MSKRSIKLSSQEEQAITRILGLIHKGEFDLSFYDQLFFAGFSAVAAYFSWQASIPFKGIGGKGTKYLPIGEFSDSFGSECAFWCSFTFYSFHIVRTALRAREAGLQYRMLRRLGVAKPFYQHAAKITTGFLMAVSTGLVFFLIARQSASEYDQLISGAVNTLLSFLGSLTLLGFFFSFSRFIKSKCVPSRRTKEELEKFSARNQQKGLLPHLQLKMHQLSKLDESCFSGIPTLSVLKNRLIERNAETADFALNDRYRLLIHLLIQLLLKFPMYGYLTNTIVSSGEFFDVQDPVARLFMGSLIFCTHAAFNFMMAYDIAEEIVKGLVAIPNQIHFLLQNPDHIKEDPVKSAFLAASILLFITTAFFAYVSSNSSLELNAQHGFQQAWNIFPASLASTLVNGYAFLMIFKGFVQFADSELSFSQSKKIFLKRGQQLHSLFSRYGHVLEECSIRETPGLQLTL